MKYLKHRVTVIINGEEHRGIITKRNYGGEGIHEMYSLINPTGERMFIAFLDSEVQQ